MLSRVVAFCFVIVCGAACQADTAIVDVTFDRWMYPFNASPGARPSGTTFNAIGNPQFDDRDAQILVGFATHSGITAGAGAANYQVNSAKVTLTTSADGSFALDSTYDPFGSYLDDSVDTDAGRPVELYGVGFRNGYTAAGMGAPIPFGPIFEENEAFGPPGPPVPANGKRNAFASDYEGVEPRDVSNSVREGYDSVPWGVGTVPSLSEGAPVPIDTALEFDLDLTNANVLSYLQGGLDAGELYFSVVSLHESVQGSSDGIPAFHMGIASGESLGQRAQLHLDYQVVPEPNLGWIAWLIWLGLPRLLRRHD